MKVLPFELGECISNNQNCSIITSIDKKYACKFSTEDLSNEFALMFHSSSDYTVKPIKYIKTNDWNCIIMPSYLDGDAFSLIENNQVTEQNIKEIIHDVLKGLVHLKAHYICHHDIKPENFFLKKQKNNKIKAFIGDFGCAELLESGIGFDIFDGSIQYQAPEILNKSTYDFQSDMWSLGISMAVLLCQKYPYDGECEEDLLNQIYDPSRRVVLPEGISPCAQDFLDKLLCIDPNQRLTAEEALHHSWFEQ